MGNNKSIFPAEIIEEIMTKDPGIWLDISRKYFEMAVIKIINATNCNIKIHILNYTTKYYYPILTEAILNIKNADRLKSANTPLMWSIRCAHHDITKILLNHAKIKPEWGCNRAIRIAVEINNTKAVKMLLQNKNVDIFDESKYEYAYFGGTKSAMEHAIKYKKMDIIRLFFRYRRMSDDNLEHLENYVSTYYGLDIAFRLFIKKQIKKMYDRMI